MKAFRKYSLRSLLIAVTTSACLFGWIVYPERTAAKLVNAIRAKDCGEVERLTGDDDFSALVRRGNYQREHVGLRGEERTWKDIAQGRQTFIVSGYESTHRVTVERGNITSVYQTWFFGGIELIR